jgi:hypothetical protein
VKLRRFDDIIPNAFLTHRKRKVETNDYNTAVQSVVHRARFVVVALSRVVYAPDEVDRGRGLDGVDAAVGSARPEKDHLVLGAQLDDGLLDGALIM